MQVPWARPRSDFTLLFEALVMALAKEMPVKAIGGLVGEHDTKIWRIVHHYVDASPAGSNARPGRLQIRSSQLQNRDRRKQNTA